MEPERASDAKGAAGRRLQRWRVFLSEVRNELERVTWPSQKEVYATTVVVMLTSIILGLYLWGLDLLLDRLVFWIMRWLGAQ